MAYYVAATRTSLVHSQECIIMICASKATYNLEGFVTSQVTINLHEIAPIRSTRTEQIGKNTPEQGLYGRSSLWKGAVGRTNKEKKSKKERRRDGKHGW